MNSRILTLTTDFGMTGSYVAALKGVLLELAPGRSSSTSVTRSHRRTFWKAASCWRGSSTLFPRGRFIWSSSTPVWAPSGG